MGSWFDVLAVGIMVGCIALGMRTGFLRQAFLLLAMYISAVLAAQYYAHISGFARMVAPASNPQMTDVLSFIFLFALFTLVVTLLIWAGYRETRLPGLPLVDNLGGALFGIVGGMFAIALTIMLATYTISAPWPEGSAVKYALSIGLGNSALEPVFSLPMPLFQGALRPLMPANIPFIF